MSDSTNFGFAKLVPGFDFLQNLAKGASQGLPQMPSLSSWVAPTLNVEELEKRIAELKAVHFWLDQNGKALGATIQALEVQKMTLATLRNMNLGMGELAEALTLKTAAGAGERKRETPSGAGARPEGKASTEARAATTGARGKQGAHKGSDASGAPAGGAPVDPLQWWGALTQQFQQIAADAMKDVAQKTAAGTARSEAARPPAPAPAPPAAKAPPSSKTARRSPARKTRAKTSR